jgi:hypothetical protein
MSAPVTIWHSGREAESNEGQEPTCSGLISVTSYNSFESAVKQPKVLVVTVVGYVQVCLGSRSTRSKFRPAEICACSCGGLLVFSDTLRATLALAW